MNFLAIISLLLLMNYSKSYMKNSTGFSENRLLQVKQIFLKNFSNYLEKNKQVSDIFIEKSLVGVKNSKQIFVNFSYRFVSAKDKTLLYKTAKVIIEPTANSGKWLVKKVTSNTQEIQFQKAFIINL